MENKMADQGMYMAIVFDVAGERFIRRLADTPVEAVRMAVSEACEYEITNGDVEDTWRITDLLDERLERMRPVADFQGKIGEEMVLVARDHLNSPEGFIRRI